MQIRESAAYITALEDTLKLLPRDAPENPALTLRPDTAVAKARNIILEAGKPLHINEILTKLGRSVNRNNRAALSGSLAAYVRKQEVFTRPAPNTFSLIELSGGTKRETEGEEEPPKDFGTFDQSGTPHQDDKEDVK